MVVLHGRGGVEGGQGVAKRELSVSVAGSSSGTASASPGLDLETVVGPPEVEVVAQAGNHQGKTLNLGHGIWAWSWLCL